MRYTVKIYLIMLLCICCAGSAATAAYLELFKLPLHVNGFMQQESAWGIDPKYSGKNVSDYSTLQLEWEYRLNDTVSLYGINRLFGDLAYSLHDGDSWFHRAQTTPTQKSRARHNLEWEWNSYDQEREIFRELYCDINTGAFQFRLGRQQVIWGESDGLRLMDCINPLDQRREFNLRDSDEGYESTRIPLWLLKTTYFPGVSPFNIRDLQVELIVNPGRPKANRLEAYQSEGGIWAADEPNLPWGVRVQTHDKALHTALEHSECAMRVLGNWHEWLFTLNAYYGFQQDFYLRPKGAGFVSPAWDRAFLQLNFDKVYDRRKLIGFTVNRELEKVKFQGTTAPVLRVEALYEFDKPFQYEGGHVGDMAWTGLNKAYSAYKKNKDQARTMLGFDWPIYIRLLNKRESFFFSSQFFVFYIFDKDGQYVNAPFYFKDSIKKAMLPPLPPARGGAIDPWRIHRTQKYFTFLVNTYYCNKQIIPEVMYLYDFEEHAHGFKAKLNFAFGSHWRPELGVMLWFGDHDTGKSFGLFEKNRQAYLRVKYQF